MGVASSNPALLLAGLVVVTTAALSRRLPRDVALPVAVLLLLAAAAVLGMLAAVLRVDLLARPAVTSGACLAVVVLMAVVAVRSPRAGAAGYPAGRRDWSSLPALAAAALGLVQSLDVRVPASWALYATDLAEHMRMLREVQDQGALDYATQFYPRGLHMLLALVSTGLPQADPARLLDYDLRLMAAACWFAAAVAIATAIALTRRLGAAMGMPASSLTVACWLLGLYLLTSNSFIEMFVLLGAAPGLLAFLALWVLPLVLRVHAPSPRQQVAVTVGAVFVLTQLWQPLAVVPLASLLACSAPQLAAGRRGWVGRLRERRRSVITIGVVAAALLGGAAAPVVGLIRAGGLSLASIVGISPRVPLLVLAMSGLTLLALAVRGRDPVSLSILGGGLGLLGLVGLALAGAGNGLDITQWYPNKALWFLAVFLSPVTALGAVAVVQRLATIFWVTTERLGAAARVTRLTVVLVVVTGFLALWVPYYDAPGSRTLLTAHGGDASNESARRFDIAQARARAGGAGVTLPVFTSTRPFGDASSAHVISKLLSMQTGQPVTMGMPTRACADLAAVASRQPVVIITTLRPSTMDRFLTSQGCARRATVLQLPGLSDADERRIAESIR